MAAVIKDAKVKDDIVPDMGSIEFRLLEDIKDDVQQKFVIKQLARVKEASLYDTLKVQDIAMKFCKQQELKKSIKQIQKIIDTGDIERYDECEEILKKAIEHGDSKDDGMDVFDNIKDVLMDDFRKPIRTGINGLDEYMDGGLSKGELGVILAAFGVGKTTMINKLANTAKNDGHNVLQIQIHVLEVFGNLSPWRLSHLLPRKGVLSIARTSHPAHISDNRPLVAKLLPGVRKG